MPRKRVVVIVERSKHQCATKISKEEYRKAVPSNCGIEQMALYKSEEDESNETAYCTKILVIRLIGGVDIPWKWDKNKPVSLLTVHLHQGPVVDEF